MVNASPPGSAAAPDPERRQRQRSAGASRSGKGADGGAAHAAALSANRNPLGDLHTLQHLSARLARSLRGVFEPLLRREVRIWAEPLSMGRFADYRAERPDGLTAWLPMTMTPIGSDPSGQAMVVLDGRFLLELLDLFFGGNGAAPHELPAELSPAAEALVARVGMMLAAPLAAAWDPVGRVSFAPGRIEPNPALVAGFDGEDAAVVTRFGIAPVDGRATTLDIVYPVAALKPFAPSLTGKVARAAAAPDPAWRSGLTRAAMTVRFPVRSVLAEPVVSLARLMELKAGDVIPISFGPEVPVMVGGDRFGAGTVGTSNGRAAVKLTSLARSPEDYA
ncbi:FliM/FliN family flagellar motor switch protein [uncultured Sphingomonas sp.]|uniref:FliM/FliN family flagellar motor switch protein n=1 Tax=uncultured Sphingomonas sp. TaxID=158754 RepID=UPI0035CBD0FA